MATEASKVTGVMLGEDWIDVKAGTFTVGLFELKTKDSPVCAHRAGTGFAFTSTDGATVTGPIVSIRAVKAGGQSTVRKGRPPANKS